MEQHSTLREDLHLSSMIKQDLVEYCSLKGLMMKSSADPADCEYAHVPISLFPTPYPLEHYQDAVKL